MAQHIKSALSDLNLLPQYACQSPAIRQRRYAQHGYNTSLIQNAPNLAHQYTDSTDSISVQPRHSALTCRPSNQSTLSQCESNYDPLALDPLAHSNKFVEISSPSNQSNQSLYDAVPDYVKATPFYGGQMQPDEEDVLFHEEKLDPAYSESAQCLSIRPFIDHQPSLSTQHIPLPAPHKPSQSATHEYWQPLIEENVESAPQEPVNPYMPKRKEQIEQTTKQHLYTMRAHFEDNLLSVEVHDAMQDRSWRNEFNRQDFPQFDILAIAKILVDAINSMSVDSGKNKIIVDAFEPISILEYGHWAYLTVNGAQIDDVQIPTFALRPV